MSIAVTQIANSDVFGTWLARTNQLANIASSNTVTADNTATGSVTTGNVNVNGNITVLNLIANTLSGQSGPINFVSNTTFGAGLNIVAQFQANATNSSVLISSNTLTFSNTTKVFGNTFTFGNSTVNATVNSTTFSGTSNSTNYVGSTPAANIVTSTQLAANIAGLSFTANPSGVNTQVQFNSSNSFGASAGFTFNTTSNTIAIGNVTNFATVNSTIFSGTANNSNYLGGNPVNTFQTTAGLIANVGALTSNNSSNFGGNPPSFYANASSYLGAFNGTTIQASGNTTLAGVVNAIAAVDISGFDSGGAQLRITQSGYGLIQRNDGVSYYHMISNTSSGYGTWNTLRPYSVSLTTGAITFDQTGAGVTFGGNVGLTGNLNASNSTFSNVNTIKFADGTSQKTAPKGGITAFGNFQTNYSIPSGLTAPTVSVANGFTISINASNNYLVTFNTPVSSTNYVVMSNISNNNIYVDTTTFTTSGFVLINTATGTHGNNYINGVGIVLTVVGP